MPKQIKVQLRPYVCTTGWAKLYTTADETLSRGSGSAYLTSIAATTGSPGLLGAHHPNAIDKSVGLPASPRVRPPPRHPASMAPPGPGLMDLLPSGPAG